MNDSSPLSEYNISENSFVVVMVTKTAAASKPAAAPAKAPEVGWVRRGRGGGGGGGGGINKSM